MNRRNQISSEGDKPYESERMKNGPGKAHMIFIRAIAA